jgi:hypothetical protein
LPADLAGRGRDHNHEVSRRDGRAAKLIARSGGQSLAQQAYRPRFQDPVPLRCGVWISSGQAWAKSNDARSARYPAYQT